MVNCKKPFIHQQYFCLWLIVGRYHVGNSISKLPSQSMFSFLFTSTVMCKVCLRTFMSVAIDFGWQIAYAQSHCKLHDKVYFVLWKLPCKMHPNNTSGLLISPFVSLLFCFHFCYGSLSYCLPRTYHVVLSSVHSYLLWDANFLIKGVIEESYWVFYG